MNKFLLLPISLILSMSNAFSFGVDVCFNDPNAGVNVVQNCLDIKDQCRTDNLDIRKQVSCRALALLSGLSGLSGTNNIIGGRSLLHSDSTYLMAQLIGFSAWDAYQIMIYDEATDQSDYVPFDQKGHQMLTNDQISFCKDNWSDAPRNCLIISPTLNGIYKFNYNTGGMLLHLHARYSNDGMSPPSIEYPTDYLSPANRKYEVVLTNFQGWVFDNREDACAGGITENLSDPTSPCVSNTKNLNSPMSFFALGFSRLAIPFVTKLGPLIINANNDKDVFATDKSLQDYIYPHKVAYAKLGIFLHVLADRYSHHHCTDNSYFYPQKSGTGDFDSTYSSVSCAQGSHFLWHTWEQGTTQTNENLNPQYQTMKPALDATFDQLVNYAHYRKIPINQQVNKEEIINNLINVLQITDPNQRLDSMVSLMSYYKVLPLPGHGNVANDSINEWLVKAGAPQP